jgi:dTMP kinase
LFITFEGIEGCGKSTQARLLVDRLEVLEIPSVLTMEPGGTEIGMDIRRILLDARNKGLPPLAELLLYEADRAIHVERLIKPALNAGKWVVCDRFFDATTAYQGYARKLDMTTVSMLNKMASPGILPALTFLIDCPVEVGLSRALKRNEICGEKGQDRFEQEKLDFHVSVRQGYLSIARENQERFIIVDGSMEIDDLQETILNHIKPFLPKGVKASF